MQIFDLLNSRISIFGKDAIISVHNKKRFLCVNWSYSQLINQTVTVWRVHFFVVLEGVLYVVKQRVTNGTIWTKKILWSRQSALDNKDTHVLTHIMWSQHHGHDIVDLYIIFIRGFSFNPWPGLMNYKDYSKQYELQFVEADSQTELL